jgi:hypothetical protein
MAASVVIPSGARILTTREDGGRVWYSLREDVPAEGATETECPETGAAVRTVTYRGRQVWFRWSQTVIRYPEAETATASARPFILWYMIPERTRYPNPSNRLYPIAVRIDGSGWIVPEDRVPYSLLAEMRENGVRCGAFPADPRAAASLIDMALTALREQMAEIVSDLARTQAAAADRLARETGRDGTPDTRSEDERVKEALRTAEAARKRIGDRLELIAQGAALFGIDRTAYRPELAAAAADATHDAILERARLYRKAATTLRAGGTAEGAAVADAIDRDGIPAVVAADVLQEHGAEAEGNALRAAFTPAEPAPVGPEPLDPSEMTAGELAAAAPREPGEETTPVAVPPDRPTQTTRTVTVHCEARRPGYDSRAPQWWVAYVVPGSERLNFADVPFTRSNRPLRAEVRVPRNASRVVVGVRGGGQVRRIDL